jgi:hypothetical protein
MVEKPWWMRKQRVLMKKATVASSHQNSELVCRQKCQSYLNNMPAAGGGTVVVCCTVLIIVAHAFGMSCKLSTSFPAEYANI